MSQHLDDSPQPLDYTDERQAMAAKAKETMFGHPKGLFVLFFAELWERFSFYGMRGLLVLYMTKALQYADEDAHSTYGAYLGFVYATPLIGGMLADRFLGYRKAIFLGGILMLLGHIAMAVENLVFFFGAMALIVAGNGFFKPNISTLVGKLYEKGDPRRDGAFTIFYMGINVGAGLAPILCGYLGEKVSWHWGFSLAAFGMAVGLAVFWWGGRYLGDHGHPPRPEALSERLGGVLPKTWCLYLGIVAFVPFAAYLFTQPLWVEDGVIRVIGPLFILYVFFEAFRCEPADRNRLLVAVVLSVFSIVFWACFEQAGSSMTLFADREVDRTIFGFEVTASQLLSINPLFIVLLGIPFSILWTRLGRVNRNPSSPVKFGLGLFQLALGFVALVMAAKQANTSGSASLGWMILAYLLHTTGELCISPVGLSAITKLSPAKLTGLMMGFWFFCTAFAGVSSGLIAKLTSGDAGYQGVFQTLVYVGLGAGLLILLLSPLLKRMEAGAE